MRQIATVRHAQLLTVESTWLISCMHLCILKDSILAYSSTTRVQLSADGSVT